MTRPGVCGRGIRGGGFDREDKARSRGAPPEWPKPSTLPHVLQPLADNPTLVALVALALDDDATEPEADTALRKALRLLKRL